MCYKLIINDDKAIIAIGKDYQKITDLKIAFNFNFSTEIIEISKEEYDQLSKEFIQNNKEDGLLKCK